MAEEVNKTERDISPGFSHPSSINRGAAQAEANHLAGASKNTKGVFLVTCFKAKRSSLWSKRKISTGLSSHQ